MKLIYRITFLFFQFSERDMSTEDEVRKKLRNSKITKDDVLKVLQQRLIEMYRVFQNEKRIHYALTDEDVVDVTNVFFFHILTLILTHT